MKTTNLFRLASLLLFFAAASQVNAQNVGVDVAVPQQKLDVLGGIRIGNTTVGLAGSIRWTGTQFEGHDGSVWAPFGGSSTSWGLTGNSGTVPATNFLGTTDNVDFRIRTNNLERFTVTAGGNVGIGTTTVSTIFGGNIGVEIKGDVPQILFNDNTGGSTDDFRIYNGGAFASFQNATASVDIMSFGLATNTNNVGIGTTAPASKLHVVGSVRMVDGNQATGFLPVSDANGTMTWTDPATVVGNQAWKLTGNTGTNANNNFVGTTDNVDLRFRTNNTVRMVITTSGNIGIGSNSPSQKLDIADGKISVATGFNNTNLFVGRGAGLASTSSAFLNTALGVEALSALTTSGDNSAVGYRNMNALTTGGANSSIGSYALSSATTAGSNVALGYGALNNLIDGNNNVAVGRAAGSGNTNGSGNIFIGFRAGDGSSGSNELYIDNSNTASPLIYGNFSTNVLKVNGQLQAENTGSPTHAKFGATNPTYVMANFPVVGFNSYFSGSWRYGTANFGGLIGMDPATGRIFISNTSASGAADAAATMNDVVNILASGNVGVGTTVPGQKLDVNGKIQMRTGATAGYIPVSDASGTMTWTDPASLTVTETDPQVSSTTTSYVPRWNGTALVDGVMFDNGTNVGIGTTSASEKLDVWGNIDVSAVQPVLKFSATGTPRTSNVTSTFSPTTTVGQTMRFNLSDNTNTGTTEIMRLQGDGTVGIGTTSPVNKLDIEGGMAVGATYSGTSVAPANGAIVEGNVGIGTTVPAQKLDVNGKIQMRTGATVGYVPVSDANGTMTWTNPTSLTITETDPQVSSTTTNYVPKWNGTTLTDGALYDNGNVGIGTTSPSSPLYVNALTASGPTVTIATGSNQYPSTLSLLPSTHATSERATIELDNWGILQDINGNGTKDFAIYNNSTTSHALSINLTNNVGIGTIIPAAKLDVNGKIQMRTGATAGYVPVSDANGTMTWTDPATVVGSQSWKLTGNSGTVSGTNFIGTTDNVPVDIKANNPASSSYVRITTKGQLYEMGTGRSVFLGEGAGDNDDLSNNDNAFIGYQAGQANTTGAANSGIGYRALKANTTGVNNTALGYDAVSSNTTGIGNTGVGFWALTGTTTGQHNTAMGVNALKNNTTGQFNTAVGALAGYDNSTPANSNTTGNNNTFIGFNSGVASSTQRNNATAIGYNAKVDATNAMVLGGTGVDAVNVGIGTTIPNQTLDVNGKIQMRTGATAGYVPVSDANGTMTWTDPATVVGSQSWKLTGNSGTVDGTNFIGTTDDVPFSIRVNNQKAGRIDNATDAKFNTFYGYQSGNVTTGVTNTGIGYQALTANAGGGGNTAVGYRALKANTSGLNNTAVGYDAIASNITGLENTGVGFWALTSTTGNSNTAVGINALKANTSGSDNTALGRYAGYDSGVPANSNTTGTKNTFIGSNAGILNSTQRDRAVAIGYNAKVDASNAMVLGGTGVDAVNVGIGTTAPANQLHVVGKIRMVDGNQSAGYVPASDGNGTMTWTDPNTLVTGLLPSGTNGQTLRHNGTTWVASSNLYHDGTYVGVGTTPSNAYLDITGTNAGTTSLQLRSGNAGSGTTSNQIVFAYSGAETYRHAIKTRHNSGADGSNAIDFYVWDFGTDAVADIGTKRVMTIDGSGITGSVGIGTSSPAAELHVVGNIRMVDGNQAAGKVLVSDANGTASWTNASILTPNKIIDADSDTKVQVEESADEDKIRFDMAGTEYLVMTAGRLNVENTGGSTFLGADAGLVDDLSSNYNTFVGFYTGKANTTGDGNTAVGAGALETNIGGSGNTAMGRLSMLNHTTGNYNVTIGLQTLYGNTSGGSNTALGSFAGENNTGSGNVFIGYSAGQNETSSSKLYIDNSNTTTPLIYGDFSSNEITLNGELGIGVNPPLDKLHVVGNIRMVDGNQAAGKVMVSDANGTASWTNASALTPNKIIDADSDTKIQVEESTDEDKIRFDMAGTEYLVMTAGRLNVANTGGSTFLGADAGLVDDLSTNFNTFVGYFSGKATTTGDANTAMGAGALESNIGGSGNTAMGRLSMLNHTSGNNNVAIGLQTLYGNTSGANNTSLGSFAGENNTGSGNLFMGYSAGQNETGSNKLYIDNSNTTSPLIWGDFSSNIVNVNGNIGVNTTSPASLLEVQSASGGLAVITIDQQGTDQYTGTNIQRDGTEQWFVGMNNSDDDFIIRADAATDYVTIQNSNGNVGIATTTPTSILAFGGDADRTIGMERTTGTDGFGLTIQAGGAKSGTADNDGGNLILSGGITTGNGSIVPGSNIIFKTATPLGSSSSADQTPSEKMKITANGNVGIGTTSPGALLHISGTVLDETDGLKITQGSNNSVIYHNSTGGLVLRKLSQTDQLVLDQNGNVGVGTSTPTQAKFVVNGSQNSSINYGYLNSGGNTGTNTGGTNAYSIYASARIAATEFNAYSDSRIKNIKGISNSNNDLNTLMNIEITDYTFVDKVEKGSAIQKKVIAQQVEKVYPQAVSTITDVVPDIYKLAEINSGRINVSNNLKTGEKVKLIFENRTELTEVISADETGFNVNLADNGKVFVFGREVNDFRTVDYEALSTLNISATQELVKMINQLQSENTEMKTKFSSLSSDVEMLKALMNVSTKAEK